MKKNCTRLSTAVGILAVTIGVLAPSVSRAEVGVVAIILGPTAPRVAHIFGVIDEGSDPIVQTRIIEDGPGPINGRRYKLGVIEDGPDPITHSRPNPVATRSRATSR